MSTWPLSRLAKSGPLASGTHQSDCREVGQLGARAAGEDEDGLADRVEYLALLKGAVLHRRQKWRSQPKALSPRLESNSSQRTNGACLASDVPDLMERVDQLRRVAHLRQVEREVFDPAGVEGRLYDRLDTKRFASARRPEDAMLSGRGAGSASYSRISARMLRKPSISPRSTVTNFPKLPTGTFLRATSTPSMATASATGSRPSG